MSVNQASLEEHYRKDIPNHRHQRYNQQPPAVQIQQTSWNQNRWNQAKKDQAKKHNRKPQPDQPTPVIQANIRPVLWCKLRVHL